jgi:Na+-driven multidrug efflux pump
MIGFALLNFLLGSSNIIDHTSNTLQTLVLINQLLYFLIVFFSIMNYVLDSTKVTSDKIFGALSAYLLMGLIWAIVFSLFQHINPESFQLSEQMQASKSTVPIWAIYFSFTTLPSLGYGDITPQTPATQSYAVMEAALGQIFLTVVVARLVALQITHTQKTTPIDQPE